MKRKLILTLLAAVLLASLLPGCANSPSTPSGQPAGDTPEDTGPRATLSWMVLSHPSYPYQEDWYAFQSIEELFNIEIEVEAVDEQGFLERLQLKMAGSEMADVTAQQGRSTAIQYGQEGAFVNLVDEMDNLPNLSVWASSNEILLETYKTMDGELYCFPFVGQAAVDQSCFYYRQDIFDEHGLSVPTTYNELYDVSKQLKGIYPDSNPFVWRGNVNTLTAMMAPQWGTGGLVYYNFEADEFRSGYIEENFYGMLEWFATMYAEDLIPPDFMSLDTPGWEQLISTDLAFLSADNCLRIDTFNQQMRADDPSWTVKYMSPPKGNVLNGTNKLPVAADASGHCVSAINENRDIALEILDKFYAPENFTRLCYGEEGKTFKMVDGRERFIGPDGEYIDIYGVCRGWGLHTPGVQTVMEPYAQVGACGATPECVEAYDLVANDVLPVASVVNFSSDLADQASDLSTLISTYANEMIAGFIMGTEPLSNWDAYVAEVERLGVAELVALYNDVIKA